MAINNPMGERKKQQEKERKQFEQQELARKKAEEERARAADAVNKKVSIFVSGIKKARTPQEFETLRIEIQRFSGSKYARKELVEALLDDLRKAKERFTR